MASSNKLAGFNFHGKNGSTSGTIFTDGRNVTTTIGESTHSEMIANWVIYLILAVLAGVLFWKRDHILQVCRDVLMKSMHIGI